VTAGWARSYWVGVAVWWGVWFAVIQAAVYVLTHTDTAVVTGFRWRGVVEFAVLSLMAAAACRLVARRHALAAALVLGFLTGAVCTSLFMLLNVITAGIGHSEQFWSAWIESAGLVSLLGGLAGMAIGAMNRSER
jgi:hypothetical protein